MDSINNPPPFVNDYQKALKVVVVRWVMPGWIWNQHAGAVLGAGDIYYEPIFVPERTAYDRIGIYVNVGDGVGGLADLRIYNWAGGLPGTLTLAPGTVSTNVAGAQEIVIAQTLERGYYFLALRGDQAPTIAGMGTGDAQTVPVPGFQITNRQAGLNNCILAVTGTMTDPARTPTSGLASSYAFVRLREA